MRDSPSWKGGTPPFGKDGKNLVQMTLPRKKDGVQEGGSPRTRSASRLPEVLDFPAMEDTLIEKLIDTGTDDGMFSAGRSTSIPASLDLPASRSFGQRRRFGSSPHAAEHVGAEPARNQGANVHSDAGRCLLRERTEDGEGCPQPPSSLSICG